MRLPAHHRRVGREIGATLGHTRELFLGLFHAPHVTGEALKTAVFAAGLMKELGFAVTPSPWRSVTISSRP